LKKAREQTKRGKYKQTRNSKNRTELRRSGRHPPGRTTIYWILSLGFHNILSPPDGQINAINNCRATRWRCQVLENIFRLFLSKLLQKSTADSRPGSSNGRKNVIKWQPRQASFHQNIQPNPSLHPSFHPAPGERESCCFRFRQSWGPFEILATTQRQLLIVIVLCLLGWSSFAKLPLQIFA